MAGETTAPATTPATPPAAEPEKTSFAEMANEWSASFDRAEDEAHEAEAGKEKTAAKTEPAEKPAEAQEPELPTVEDLLELAKQNKAVEILKALGVKAPEKVAAKQWADFRNAQKTFQGQKQEFERVIGALETKYSRFEKAEKLQQEGDLLGSFAEFYGGHDKIDEVTTAIIKQKGQRDPEAWREIQRLKAKEAKEEQEKQAAEEQRKAQQEAQQVANNRAAVLQHIQKEAPQVFAALQASNVQTDAPTVAHLLITAARKNVEDTGEDLTVEEAIQAVATEMGRIHKILTASGADPGGNRAVQDPGDIPESEPDQGGQTPAQLRARPALSHQRARGAGVKPPKRTYSESLAEAAAELQRALGGGN